MTNVCDIRRSSITTMVILIIAIIYNNFSNIIIAVEKSINADDEFRHTCRRFLLLVFANFHCGQWMRCILLA